MLKEGVLVLQPDVGAGLGLRNSREALSDGSCDEKELGAYPRVQHLSGHLHRIGSTPRSRAGWEILGWRE